MASTLSGIGLLWSFLSMVAAVLLSVAFYMPFWMRGEIGLGTTALDVDVGLFRRCNYPSESDDGTGVVLVEECGRYATFYDIPSPAWQACTVLVGSATVISLIIAFAAMFACCISDVFGRCGVRLAGGMQLLAAGLTAGGAALYPYGWGSPEIKDICGQISDDYVLGTCTLSWGYYLACGTCGLLIFTSLMSCHGTKTKSHSYNV